MIWLSDSSLLLASQISILTKSEWELKALTRILQGDLEVSV